MTNDQMTIDEVLGNPRHRARFTTMDEDTSFRVHRPKRKNASKRTASTCDGKHCKFCRPVGTWIRGRTHIYPGIK